jgi:serine/threonine protein kinase
MTAPVQAGEVLAGKYRIERVLGRGGMGVVVAARHVELDELVALKFLLPEALSEPEPVARFLKEARAAVRIKNEHVARVLDVGQLESGAPYIVMEYLDGRDLGALLRSRGAMPVDDVVDYVAQACEAIANAHALGIVHRDLKPSNLMLMSRTDGSACIKVLDFGISKITSTGDSQSAMSMTRTAAFLGSPLYMSPEQMMSAKDVDGRTDIWALGTIFYELLTGKPPFTAETLPALGVLIATSEPVPLRALRPEVPPGLQEVVARCLAKHRDDRFASVAEFAQAMTPFAPERARVSLERAARILPASGSPSTKSGRTSPKRLTSARGAREDLSHTATVGHLAQRTATASNWGHTASGFGGRRRMMVVVAGALMVIATAAAASLLVFSRGGPARPVAASSLPSTAAHTPPAASVHLIDPPAATESSPPAGAPAADSAAPEVSLARPAGRPPLAPHASATTQARPPSSAIPKPASIPTPKSAYEDM